MRFDRASGHIELCGNLGIVTALQQQVGNLLFPRAQANRLLLHFGSFPPELVNPRCTRKFPTNPLLQAPFAVLAAKEARNFGRVSKIS